MDLGLTGRVALVAGAGSDVGREVARRLAAEGARVGLVGRTESALAETAELIAAAGGSPALVVPGDSREDASVLAAVARVSDELGPIQVVVNTVGPFPRDPRVPEPMYGDDASWEWVFENLFMTAVRLTRAVMPAMKADGSGSIVHLAANSARYYHPMTAQYAAMKSTLVHATKNWARDAIKSGVRVNAVLPGWIQGQALADQIAADSAAAGRSADDWERAIVAEHDSIFWSGRMGKLAEYADVITFLVSDRASYINGALIPVDGGSPVW
jgi:3-oxoacyl-[acyl-carrier protein] reductase